VLIVKAKVPFNETYRPPQSQHWRLKAYHIVTSYYFEVTIISVIFLNMI